MVFIFCGCAKVQHLDQLLTLKAIANEQTAALKLVEQQDKKFEEMLALYHENRLEKYSTKEKIVKKFGPPITTREVTKDGAVLGMWLYRYSTQFFGSEKIYVYFDQSEKVVDVQYFQPPQDSEGPVADETQTQS